jgi:hypothetical protein
MAAPWVLVDSLVSLRDEFNELAPGRAKASDGSIGDTAHQAESSDHNADETGSTPYEDSDTINEVHALDVTTALNKAGWTMQRAVDIIVSRHKRGLDARLIYVIYNRRIWEADNNWLPSTYYGDDPHTGHAHFSARYGSGSTDDNPENRTAPWGLLEDDMPTAEEYAQEVAYKLDADLSNKDSGLYKRLDAHLDARIAAAADKLAQADASKLYIDLKNDGAQKDASGKTIPGPSGIRLMVDNITDGHLQPLAAQVSALAAQNVALTAKLDQVLTLLTTKE